MRKGFLIGALVFMFVCRIATSEHSNLRAPAAGWTETPTVEQLEFRRLLHIPRELLTPCPENLGERLVDALNSDETYDRSFTLGESRIVCVRGGPDLRWIEIAQYFSQESGAEVEVKDMSFVPEYYWYEVQVEGRYYYYPVNNHYSLELERQATECGSEYNLRRMCTAATQLEAELERRDLES